MDLIFVLINEYYELPIGNKIDKHLEIIYLAESNIKIKISRRALKHVVERRKIDGYSIQEICDLFVFICNIKNNDYKILDNNNGNYLLVEIDFNKNKGVVSVLEVIKKENEYYVITAFLRATSKIKKLIKTNSH